MSMNRKKLAQIFLCFIAYVSCGWNAVKALSGIPFLLLGLPIIGQLGGASTKTGVKRTLANVDDVVWYVWLFLIVASLTIITLFILWLVHKIRKNTLKKKTNNIMRLLHQIQSDLVLLQKPEILEEKQLLAIKLSKKEAIFGLKKAIKIPFFKKKLGKHAYARMRESLDFIEQNKIDTKNQAILVEQWLKTIDLML